MNPAGALCSAGCRASSCRSDQHAGVAPDPHAVCIMKVPLESACLVDLFHLDLLLGQGSQGGVFLGLVHAGARSFLQHPQNLNGLHVQDLPAQHMPVSEHGTPIQNIVAIQLAMRAGDVPLI